MKKSKIVILTGAGISAESGLATFRGSGGLWNGYDINEVATFDGWQRNPNLVLQFYNERRKAAFEAQPNEGHKALVRLEAAYDVTIITQNVDDLHERAGSTNVLHLHGMLRKARSIKHPDLVYDIGDKAIQLGDLCEKGAQLRPHIVWFGEAVPMIEVAAQITGLADVFIVIGTSLAVYPAAGLIGLAPDEVKKYIIDPYSPSVYDVSNLHFIKEKASIGVPQLVDELLGSPL